MLCCQKATSKQLNWIEIYNLWRKTVELVKILSSSVSFSENGCQSTKGWNFFFFLVSLPERFNLFFFVVSLFIQAFHPFFRIYV